MGFSVIDKQSLRHPREPETAPPRRDFVESGLRYYSSTLARWINRDPIGERGGWNLYNFVRNGPPGRSDYLGREERPRSWRPWDEAQEIVDSVPESVDAGQGGFDMFEPDYETCKSNGEVPEEGKRGDMYTVKTETVDCVDEFACPGTQTTSYKLKCRRSLWHDVFTFGTAGVPFWAGPPFGGKYYKETSDCFGSYVPGSSGTSVRNAPTTKSI